MRRTLRPTKATLAPTGNRMLDIAIRMAGSLEQQEKEAAEAAAQYTPAAPLAVSTRCCTQALHRNVPMWSQLTDFRGDS